jgi:hypothetical protein
LHRQNLFEEEDWFLVLPQVINLAGICIDKTALRRRRRGKPATSYVLYESTAGNMSCELACTVQCSLAHFEQYKWRPEFQLQLNSTIKSQMSAKR